MHSLFRKHKFRIEIVNKPALIRLAILFLGLLIVFFWLWLTMFRMPGASYLTELPPLQKEEIILQDFLRQDIQKISDQWSFWQQGYQGIMVTDTAPYRYPYYHRENDTFDKINFDKFTRVVAGLTAVISDLAE